MCDVGYVDDEDSDDDDDGVMLALKTPRNGRKLNPPQPFPVTFSIGWYSRSRVSFGWTQRQLPVNDHQLYNLDLLLQVRIAIMLNTRSVLIFVVPVSVPYRQYVLVKLRVKSTLTVL